MYCDLCDSNYDMYYYKRHINTYKHLEELEKLKEKLNTNEYNTYIKNQYNKCKNKTYKIEKYITIKRGTFKLSF